MQGSPWINMPQWEKSRLCRNYLCEFNKNQGHRSCYIPGTLINGPAAGGTTWLLYSSCLLHISLVCRTILGPNPISFFFFLQVQKVHKSSLERCQPFRERRKVLFLRYFYLPFKERPLHHLCSGITWSQSSSCDLRSSARHCPQGGILERVSGV